MTYRNIISLISRIREKANRLIIRELSNHGMKELSPSHGDILSALFRRKSLSMKELAQTIDRDKSTVTALVNKLISLKYIKKTNDAADSRKSIISLTDKSKKLLPDFMEISEKLISKFTEVLEKEELNLVVKVLNKVNANWE